jgi:hypothetical protein
MGQMKFRRQGKIGHDLRAAPQGVTAFAGLNGLVLRQRSGHQDLSRGRGRELAVAEA